MADGTELGDYLRARRALVQPEDAGVQVVGVRRVPGLRREEVATLAGVSADYYLRLEQGRDRNPSPQVLDALARVLRLDAAATAYLHALAGPRQRDVPRPLQDRVPTGTLQLLDVLGLPAFVEGRFFDVLAANAQARALFPGLGVGSNRLRSVFLDPGERALHPEWERILPSMLANFRASAGTDTDDPRYRAVVDELTERSEAFRALWARHDVRVPGGGATRMVHPQVGELHLRREKLAVGGTDGQLLVVYHAEAGSSSAESLALLGSLAAMQQAEAPEPA